MLMAALTRHSTLIIVKVVELQASGMVYRTLRLALPLALLELKHL